jgi:hypothetical protein
MKFNVLALGDRFSAAYSSIEYKLLEVGNLMYKSEHDFKNVDDAINYIKSSQPLIHLVLMPNPYGNKRRMFIYKKLKEINFPVVVFDRGALPDSWFFDTGFNADSTRYHPLYWDCGLDNERKENIIEYIKCIKNGEKALEEQGTRLGGSELKKQLNLEDKKIIFVPFQRPEDTVIKYFSNGYDHFISEIEKLQKYIKNELGDEWQIIAKKHPLETKNPTDNITCVESDTNIYDLIEMSDYIVLINSGVGVLSMLWEKPVFYFGEVFYGHPKLNLKVNSYLDVLYNIKKGFQVDKEIMYRFIYYLKEEVYSFGDFITEKVLQKDGSYRNITRFINFYEFKFPKLEELLKKKYFL